MPLLPIPFTEQRLAFLCMLEVSSNAISKFTGWKIETLRPILSRWYRGGSRCRGGSIERELWRATLRDFRPLFPKRTSDRKREIQIYAAYKPLFKRTRRELCSRLADHPEFWEEVDKMNTQRMAEFIAAHMRELALKKRGGQSLGNTSESKRRDAPSAITEGNLLAENKGMCAPSVTDELTDEQWAMLEPLVPTLQKNGRSKYERRAVIGGIVCRCRAGCTWQSLPKTFPPGPVLAVYFSRWQRDGTWKLIHQKLRELKVL